MLDKNNVIFYVSLAYSISLKYHQEQCPRVGLYNYSDFFLNALLRDYYYLEAIWPLLKRNLKVIRIVAIVFLLLRLFTFAFVHNIPMSGVSLIAVQGDGQRTGRIRSKTQSQNLTGK